jgi:hypothetical protein
MADKVSCVTCGFLGVRNPHKGDAIEATEQVRRSCLIRLAGDTHIAEFICHKNIKRFSLHELQNAGQIQKAINHVFECPEYAFWIPGKSPEKLEEMTLLAKMEQRSAQLRAEDFEWKKQIEASLEKRHQENRQDFKRYTLIIGIASVVSVVISIISIIKAGH